MGSIVFTPMILICVGLCQQPDEFRMFTGRSMPSEAACITNIQQMGMPQLIHSYGHNEGFKFVMTDCHEWVVDGEN